jgi:hypothetical protein
MGWRLGVLTEITPPNQSMKPTAPWRNNFSELATDPARGLSLSFSLGSARERSQIALSWRNQAAARLNCRVATPKTVTDSDNNPKVEPASGTEVVVAVHVPGLSPPG